MPYHSSGACADDEHRFLPPGHRKYQINGKYHKTEFRMSRRNGIVFCSIALLTQSAWLALYVYVWEPHNARHDSGGDLVPVHIHGGVELN
jgi:hypothetical protein